MKSLTNIVGIILIIAGIAVLAYRGYTYTTEEQVAKIGPLEVTAEKQKTVLFPPLLGGAAIVIGVVLVIVARVGRPK